MMATTAQAECKQNLSLILMTFIRISYIYRLTNNFTSFLDTESYRKLLNLNEIEGLSQIRFSNGENSSENNHLVFLDDSPPRYRLSRSRCKRQSQSVQYLSPICLLVLGLIAIQHVPAYFRPVLSWSFNDRNNSNLDAVSPVTY